MRWLWSLVVDTNGVYNPLFDIVADLNEHPERYEGAWTKWTPYKSPWGRETTIGDDETLEVGRRYVFAVQAMDRCGATTSTFEKGKNLRLFTAIETAPLLKIVEPYLGGFVVKGRPALPNRREFAPGVALSFRWSADASADGGEIVCYGYGWNVADVYDPSDWDSGCSPFVRGCKATWYSGTRTLYVEAVDRDGNSALGMIEVQIVPFPMARNLLWVDDFPSSNFAQTDHAMPTENEHGEFWLGRCAKAAGFDPARDAYDAYYGHNGRPPSLPHIGGYRNVIWTYSSAFDFTAWDDVIRFTPESLIGSATGSGGTNAAAVFLAKGGRLLTEGNSERAGGLAACLIEGARSFPMSLECEIAGNRSDCDGDRSGVHSMPFRDYCVSVIDKIVAAFRLDSRMPVRRARNYDCMTHALRADDLVALGFTGLPERLDLWEEVTKPGRYFDPQAPEPRPGGFTLVELYDPAYWMAITGAASQECFHPMFRMKAKNSLSPMNDAAAALVITKHEHAGSASPGATGAKSFHFGFELWYFIRWTGSSRPYSRNGVSRRDREKRRRMMPADREGRLV